jgi:hypothetical protein
MLDGSVESLVTGDVAEGGDMLGVCFWELYRDENDDKGARRRL